MLAIRRETLPQIQQPRIPTMFINETRETDAAMPLAGMAFDFEQVDFALQLAKRD